MNIDFDLSYYVTSNTPLESIRESIGEVICKVNCRSLTTEVRSLFSVVVIHLSASFLSTQIKNKYVIKASM